MYPMLWEASGIGYRDLITRLVDLAIEQHRSTRSETRAPREVVDGDPALRDGASTHSLHIGGTGRLTSTVAAPRLKWSVRTIERGDAHPHLSADDHRRCGRWRAAPPDRVPVCRFP